MNQTDEQFRGIANDMMSDEANNLLNEQLDRVVEWRRRQREAGKPDDLMALIRQVHQEPNKRGPVLAAYAAAMWRLLEQNYRI